jgi:hypothetical protein
LSAVELGLFTKPGQFQFQLVTTTYAALLDRTVIVDAPPAPTLTQTVPGLKLLRLATRQGQLRVEY